MSHNALGPHGGPQSQATDYVGWHGSDRSETSHGAAHAQQGVAAGSVEWQHMMQNHGNPEAGWDQHAYNTPRPSWGRRLEAVAEAAAARGDAGAAGSGVIGGVAAHGGVVATRDEGGE